MSNLFSNNKRYSDNFVKFLPIDTIPEKMEENVYRIEEIVKSKKSFDNIYLIGYSMGGAVAALAAHKINQSTEGTIKGLVLIDTQTDGLQTLKELSVPILFYHGKEDQVFPLWQIESVYKSYHGRKKMVEIDDLNHDLALTLDGHRSKSKSLTQELAKDLFTEISHFFLNNDNDSEQDIVNKAINLPPKKSALEVFVSLFKKTLS